MASNPWEVSEAEYQKNIQLFNQLTCGQPFMDAITAKNALMRSNLPATVLAQIWSLSDMDKDGRLDIREYSIAMRLAFNCLAGIPLPPTLPPSLLTVPSRSAPLHQAGFPGMPGIAPPAVNGPPPVNWSGSRQSSIDHGNERRMSQTSNISYSAIQSRHNSIAGSPIPDRNFYDGKELGNWAIPYHLKLKYSQLFNSLDKERVGFLSTQAARSALGLSGLPTNILAQVWALSDVNKDGKLSVEEYCISQYLIDMFKGGFALPRVTPPELVGMCGISRSANNTPELEPGAEPAQKSPAPKTFEDKRQDNFAKGQAELERRRQILLDEENRRKAEIEKKEREDAERRERERAEKERQLELERQEQLERERLLEQQREEEEKRRRAEMERLREEEEKSRKMAAEKAQVKRMHNQKQQENERLAQRQQREKTLAFQLQALDEKSSDIEGDLEKAKEAISVVTREIEEMRGVRDEKLGRIQELQQENQKLSIESQEMGHQLLQMQSSHKETSNRKNALEELRKRRDAMKQALKDAQDHFRSECEKTEKIRDEYEEKENKYNNETHAMLASKREEYKKIFELFVHAQKQAQSKLLELKPQTPIVEKQQCMGNNQTEAKNLDSFSEFGRKGFDSDPFTSTNNKPITSNPSIPKSESRSSVVTNSQIDPTKGTTKCRALYAFEARTEDELSFEPGDVIIAFESHAAEPGWRAGQLKDKVGWFPEAFVEPIAAIPPATTEPPIQNMPPNMTPSCSLDRIPEENLVQKKANMIKQDSVKMGEMDCPVLCQVMAQFQWRARNDDDLSFSKGDIIDVIEKQEMKWKGRKSSGESGWFPKSYVKPIGGSPDSSPVKSKTSPISGGTTNSSSLQYDVVPAENSIIATTESNEVYIAVYDFDAVEPTDLSLRVGDKIVVIEKDEDWWKGRCNGKEGIFPANYVQKDESPKDQFNKSTVLCHAQVIVNFTASAPNQLDIKVGENIKVREKSGAGWWEGELMRNGKPVAGWFPGEYVKIVNSTEVESSTKITAKALFAYNANQNDELTFNVGDEIVVVDKTESEWWKGYLVNDPDNTGLFPANYVELK